MDHKLDIEVDNRSSLVPAFEDEKVEVMIKELIKINPKDFQAFKHALEEFVNSWDK